MSSMLTKWPGRRILDQTVYDNGVWKCQQVDPLKLDPVITGKLTICTYNIWFGNERQQVRMQRLLQIIQEHDCDIFCFQEVTQQLLRYLLASPFVQQYHVSGITNNDVGAYGNVIFSRWPLTKVYINHYQNTGMSRKLVCVDLLINNELFRIATVHLESLAPGARKRVQQLKESMRFMVSKHKPFNKRPQHLMIMGDFNECATSNKQALCMPDAQFIEAWSEYHGGDGQYEKKHPGWTMPETDYFAPWRPDRLYYAFDYDYSELDEKQKQKEKEKEAKTGSLDSAEEEADDGDKGGQFDFSAEAVKQNDTNGDTEDTKTEKKEDDTEDVVKYEVKGKEGQWALKKIERVGMEKIELTKQEKKEVANTSGITIFTPSDHYGLIAQFVCIGMEQEEKAAEIVKSRKLDDDKSGCLLM